MKKVKRLLATGGTFAMYNYYESWLLDRYAGTLQTVYGNPPCVEVGDPLAGRRQAVLRRMQTFRDPDDQAIILTGIARGLLTRVGRLHDADAQDKQTQE